MADRKETCQTCKYVYEFKDLRSGMIGLECWRNPPTATPIMATNAETGEVRLMAIQNCQPRVNDRMWCGEYQFGLSASLVLPPKSERN